jgi:carbon monoxide dehydrogenase subunit G
MELKHDFEIPTNLDHAWQVMLDVPRIAPCLPGAELTEVIDEHNFKGLAAIRVGPVALKFTGQAELTEVDDANHSAIIKAKGADNKGRGQAQATVVFQLSAAGDNATRVDVTTDLNLTGTVAQYGRASGLIDEIANQLIAQFVSNLEGVLQQDQPGAAATDGEGAASTDETPPSAPAPAAKPVSGLSLLFRALGAMIKRWFGG